MSSGARLHNDRISAPNIRQSHVEFRDKYKNTAACHARYAKATEFCAECGKPALRRVGLDGYCKAHYAVAQQRIDEAAKRKRGDR